MSKIIATYNSHLSSIQPAPLCPTWKCQSASHSGVRLFVIPWIVAQPGSSVHGILQARILKWVALSFPRGSSPPRAQTWVSHIAGRLFNNWATREACRTSGASQFSCVLQEWGAGFPANPIRPPTSQGGSSSLCWIPWLGHPVCGLNCWLPRAEFHLCKLSFLLTLPRGTDPSLITSLPFFHNSCQSLLQYLLYRNLSASF